MGGGRQVQAKRLLAGLPMRGSLLDVATGRGELLTFARDAGYTPVRGTEIVPDLCNDDVTEAFAHDLPFADGSFDVVTCFDVLEHLLPDDTEKVIAELFRVARRATVLTIATYSHQENGVEYHVNLRSPAEWRALLPDNPKRFRVFAQQIEVIYAC